VGRVTLLRDRCGDTPRATRIPPPAREEVENDDENDDEDEDGWEVHAGHAGA
jgi:hypothetical protein